MNTIYWITTLGTLSNISCIFTGLVSVSLLIIFYIIINNEEFTAQTIAIAKKSIKWLICFLIPLILINIFIPNKKDLYIIYGVGTTLDYLKDNPKANQLPDKCINALGTWLDNLNIEDKKKE